MSIPISLTRMPNLVMKHIMEYLDFSSILILRKTCLDLRNFIDDNKPASRLTEIHMDVKREAISFSLQLPHYWGHIFLRNDYVNNGDGCLVRSKKESNVKETMLVNEDFVTVFCKDFDIVLRHQKTLLEDFKIIFFIFTEPNVKERVLESVNKSLKSMNHPIQVKSLHMAVSNHHEILTILPYIDPKSLEKIYLNEPSRSLIMLNIDDIGQLEQWKQAKELTIERFQVPVLAQNLQHFSRINFHFRNFHIEEIVLLKEIFVSSLTLTTVVIYCNICYSKGTLLNSISQRLDETFGQPFIDTNQDRNWFLRIPDTNQFLKIKNFNNSIYFYRIPQSDLPHNALISS